MDIGQTKVSGGMAIHQFFVVKSQLVQQGGMKIVDMNRVLFRLKPKLIGGAHHPRTHPPPSYPHGETIGVVIAPIEPT